MEGSHSFRLASFGQQSISKLGSDTDFEVSAPTPANHRSMLDCPAPWREWRVRLEHLLLKYCVRLVVLNKETGFRERPGKGRWKDQGALGAKTRGQTKQIKTFSPQRGRLHGEMIKGRGATKGINMFLFTKFQRVRPSWETKIKGEKNWFTQWVINFWHKSLPR